MIYYLHWRNSLVTAAYNYFKIVWDCQQILVRCSPSKSTQLVANSSISKFNNLHNSIFNTQFNIQHTIQYSTQNSIFSTLNNVQNFKVKYLTLGTEVK